MALALPSVMLYQSSYRNTTVKLWLHALEKDAGLFKVNSQYWTLLIQSDFQFTNSREGPPEQPEIKCLASGHNNKATEHNLDLNSFQVPAAPLLTHTLETVFSQLDI